MAASSSTSVLLPSCSLRRLFALHSSEFASSRSHWCSPLPRQPARRRSLSAFSRRSLVPLIEAKKQTFSSFDDLLQKSDKPVLADFYALWCGPCQFMVPVLEEVSGKMKDRIQVVKIDIDKYANIANRYKIQALPTFVIFIDGNPCDRFEGAVTASQLIHRVESALKVSK